MHNEYMTLSARAAILGPAGAYPNMLAKYLHSPVRGNQWGTTYCVWSEGGGRDVRDVHVHHGRYGPADVKSVIGWLNTSLGVHAYFALFMATKIF